MGTLSALWSRSRQRSNPVLRSCTKTCQIVVGKIRVGKVAGLEILAARRSYRQWRLSTPHYLTRVGKSQHRMYSGKGRPPPGHGAQAWHLNSRFDPPKTGMSPWSMRSGWRSQWKGRSSLGSLPSMLSVLHLVGSFQSHMESALKTPARLRSAPVMLVSMKAGLLAGTSLQGMVM